MLPDARHIVISSNSSTTYLSNIDLITWGIFAKNRCGHNRGKPEGCTSKHRTFDKISAFHGFWDNVVQRIISI
jgi:hypothetical protein